jgi:acyl transferase domain-containing protein
MQTIFMFSGQGSQYFQMGRELFERDAVFKRILQELDEIAHELCGCSIVETLYFSGRGKGDWFDRTLLTHPAIFMVEYSLARALIEAGVIPDAVLGSSLGSFAAAALAGCVSVEDALVCVVNQAKAFEAHCEPGGMLAILAPCALYEDDILSRQASLAAVNFDSHFVVSAPRRNFTAIEKALQARNVVCQPIPVSFAFHSQWIDAARTSFLEAAQRIPLRRASLPLVCCDRAEVLTALTADYFWNIARSRIRFREAIARLESTGSYRYIDAGPAGTLATFLKYGLHHSASEVHAVLTPYSRDLQNWVRLTGRGHGAS